jgi:hypothetical protein
MKTIKNPKEVLKWSDIYPSYIMVLDKTYIKEYNLKFDMKAILCARIRLIFYYYKLIGIF